MKIHKYSGKRKHNFIVGFLKLFDSIVRILSFGYFFTNAGVVYLLKAKFKNKKNDKKK